jgi:hypothetical protein
MELAQITPYGGITVMIPAALVIGAWLWFSASRRSALLWAATLLGVYVIVGFSKILFKGWGIGLHSLNIAVISGHAMNTCLVVTVTLSLLARQISPSLRWPAALLGLVLGWLFAIFCVAPFISSTRCKKPSPARYSAPSLPAFFCTAWKKTQNSERSRMPHWRLVWRSWPSTPPPPNTPPNTC